MNELYMCVHSPLEQWQFTAQLRAVVLHAGDKNEGGKKGAKGSRGRGLTSGPIYHKCYMPRLCTVNTVRPTTNLKPHFQRPITASVHASRRKCCVGLEARSASQKHARGAANGHLQVWAGQGRAGYDR